MAIATSTSAPSPTPTGSSERDRSTVDIGATPTPDAIFAPFSWLPRSMRGNTDAEFIARTRDVCMGVKTIIEIVHNDTQDRGQGEDTLLSISQNEYLSMLAIQAVEMLAEEADREIEFMHKRARAEVQS